MPMHYRCFTFGFYLTAGLILGFLWISGNVASAQVLGKRQLLEQETFWDNRDWQWYEANIPFLEVPDQEIQTTYYYRWEVVTKHLTYGSPASGYSFTEFIDRPFWSGRYGAISCPAGHQLYEVRWLRDPRYSQDYSRYWFETEGAQPRNYSTWLADAIYATSLVHPHPTLYQKLLPGMIENWKLWEERHFDRDAGLFWQTGHDDGMEFNINSRQTTDILRGAPGYRPTLNSYLWADAKAIASFAKQTGDLETAANFDERADEIKKQLQSQLWDQQRGFFFHKYKQDERANGFTIKKGSLTHQTGKFAGSEHGRELMGYAPWQFNLPDAGYESAWKFLMDPKYFLAPYGPTVTERNDPLFLVTDHCCWWSGQSWPYATSQTLKGMANLLQRYQQKEVSREDYFKLLKIYTRTHRKNGLPYIAEGANPDSGAWDGYDNFNHSEHYFHSSYCDPVITGLIGLNPLPTTQDPTTKETLHPFYLDPLAPADWDYFALDAIPFAGQQLTVIWDRTGTRYKRNKGLQLLLNGVVVAQRDDLGRLDVTLRKRDNQWLVEGANPPIVITEFSNASSTTEPSGGASIRVNWCVNNDGNYFPRIDTSSVGEGSSVAMLNDGNYFYHVQPTNRWTSEGSTREEELLEVDFGKERLVDELVLYFLDDTGSIEPPSEYRIERQDSEQQWIPLVESARLPEVPTGRRGNRIRIEPIAITKFRVILQPRDDRSVGLSEIEAWGSVSDYETIMNDEPAVPKNLSIRQPDQEFPKVNASHTSRFDQVEMANDGIVSFRPQPHNRWTSYESKNKEDWLQIEFGKEVTSNRVELAIYDDGGGVQAPQSIRLQCRIDDRWQDIEVTEHVPTEPIGGRWNQLLYAPVTSDAIRILFEHRGDSRSGISEVIVHEP